jgi:primosomal protein N' (replication factor Y)
VVLGCPDSLPQIPENLISLGKWLAEYYVADWSEVLQTLLPAPVREAFRPRERPKAYLTSEGLASASLPGKPADLSAKQWAILCHLQKHGPTWVSELIRACESSTAPVTALRRKGLISIRKESAELPPVLARKPVWEPHLEFTPEQKNAWEKIAEVLAGGKYQAVLVQGVTGSGKTELYLRAIAEVVKRGQQAIFLIPEISLTPQFADQLAARFGSVAILHSHLSRGDRAKFWRAIHRGDVRVVLGARSAIFAPTQKLGLIVVDEEQEWSYKQENAPRYHAREVALARGRLENVPVLLGSATPALETYAEAQEGRMARVVLPTRVLSRPMPVVEIVDLRDPAVRRGGFPLLTLPLRQAIAQAVEEGSQVILLLNRRGYSAAVLCPICGWVLRCPGCDVALTFHRQQQSAICHYCEYHVALPDVCPQCKSPRFHFLGAGTQRLEAEVRRLFPEVSVARVDADSMRPRLAYQQTFNGFSRGAIQVLVGTQLIAKGLHFPQVGLVGVVNADLALHLPNFRAAERTFQLLTQVAGRTGRGEKAGRVIIQTFCPEHPAIQAAALHDYERFATYELAVRRRYGYPPFTMLVRLETRSTRSTLARAAAQDIVERIRQHFPPKEEEYRLLGPAPCFIPRIARRYRFQILIATKRAELRQEIVQFLDNILKLPETVTWFHDIDPLESG